MLFGWILFTAGVATADARLDAKQILDATGVRGGLVVHLGCGDGKLTAALRANEGFLVHGLDDDATHIETARQHLQSLKQYGPVAVEQWRGPRLPYTDNLVNLIVISGDTAVDRAELLRVLAPTGVACFANPQSQIANRTLIKPRPADIDEWTHYLHGPDNNAVAHDTVVGPPRHLQWVAGPLYGRHHDRMSSVSAVVTSGGRVFSIVDEGSRISILLPAQWSLIARDAFSGVVLWKRPIEKWFTSLWPLKSGPAQLPRRLVAAADRVYVTLGIDGPLVALDAATGQTVRTCANTRATEEIVLSDGVLFLLVNPAPPPDPDLPLIRKGYNAVFPDEAPRRIMALRAVTGEVLWTSEQRVLPVTLAASGDGVFFHNGDQVVALDRRTGKERWHSAPVPRAKEIRGFYAPILVVQDDVVLFSGGETASQQTGSWYLDGEDTMTALSARDGKELWKAYHPPSGYRSPEDLLVVNGLVWTGETTSGLATGKFTGRDLHTGAVKAEFAPDVDTYWFHHRCYRGRATDNYLLMSRTGSEFVDFRKQHWIPEHWVRGACLYGLMPANGLLYAPQHPCACYLEAKLSGFNALAPARNSVERRGSRVERLERGPAFGEIANRKSQIANPADWPTYRHDAARSGRSPTAVPATLKPGWQTEPGGKLSALTIAGGQVFVASVNTHTVHALDEGTGRKLWSFTAGGRVDSPPTIWQGRALFGSADGHVYCLRATDGALVWRFRAAPRDERAVAFDQVESVWPVPGNVLVREGVVYFVAGRSMFLDGGLRLWRLDAASGRVLSETVLDEREDATGKPLQSYVSWLNMPTGLPDILSSDGRFVYMRSQPFKLDGARLPLTPMPRDPDYDKGAVMPEQRPAYSHLFCPTGFTDDTGWHRTYWLYGSAFVSGWNGYYLAGKTAPAGRLLVFDDKTVYGFGRKPQYFRWSTPMEDHLFATDKAASAEESTPQEVRRGKQGKQGAAPGFRVKFHWTQDVPLLARGMVLAGGTLFVAGPPQFLGEEQAFKQITDAALQPTLVRQAAAYEGREGGLLRAVKAVTGEKLAELKLDSPPVFDGMAAANGRLFLSTMSGQVISLGATTTN